MPRIKGVNDFEEDLRLLIDFLLPYKDFKNLQDIDLLPYKKLRIYKYAQLGWKYSFYDYLISTQ